MPGLARALRGRARFVVIGDGGRRAALEQALQAAGTDNVELRAPVARDRLIEEYRRADVLFLHLGAHAAFEKVLPSKLFEYAALGTDARLLAIPEKLLRIAGRLTGRSAEIARLCGSLQADIAPLREQLGWRACRSVDEELALTAAWFRAQEAAHAH